MRRRDFITLLGGAATAWPLVARAQQSERMRHIGVLLAYAENDPQSSHDIATLLEGFRQSGWTPGHNIQIDYRWGEADRDRFQRYATELVKLKPDLLVGQGTPAVAALQRATSTIPIVFVNVSDPIGSGFIDGLARPGSNITGFSNFEPSMGGKWVGLLKEIAPQVARIALMSNPQISPQARGYLPSIESAARSLALQPIATSVHDAAEIERAIAALGRDAAGGLVMLSDSFTLANRVCGLPGLIRSANRASRCNS
jgi:putative ABC transport system substrate-binding protein